MDEDDNVICRTPGKDPKAPHSIPNSEGLVVPDTEQ